MLKPNARRRWKKQRRAPGQAGGPSKDELALVQQLVVALERIERAAALYPPGSPAIQGLCEELFEKTKAALARAKVIELVVGPEEIEYEGHPVYDGSKSERSLSFTLDDGGVRRLVLLEGIEKAEIDALVAALHEARARDAEDLVTLLWQRDLKHVSFVAVNVYADASGEETIEALDPARATEGLIDRLKGRKLSVDMVASVKAGAARAASEAGAGAAGGAAGAADEAPEIFELSAGEQAEARRLISDHAEESPAPLLATVLLALLEGAGDEGARAGRLASLEKTLAALLDEGDVVTAAETLVAVKRLAESGTPDRASIRGHGAGNPMKHFLAAAASKENGKRLAKLLQKSRDEEAVRAARLFLLGCGRHAFSLAGELLGVSSHDAAIISALAQACGGDVAEVRERVVDPNARLAAASVRILAEAAGDAGIEDYRRALQHRDPLVRKEAVLALSRCKDARAVDRIVEAMDDAAPEVRAAARRAFPARLPAPRPDLFERLKKRSDDERAFDERPAEEQTGHLACLARLDPGPGIRLLAGMANGSSILHRDRTQRRRLRAIAALGELGREAAEEALAPLAEAKQDDVRAAARAALDRSQIMRRSPPLADAPPGVDPGPAGAVPGGDQVYGSRKWMKGEQGGRKP